MRKQNKLPCAAGSIPPEIVAAHQWRSKAGRRKDRAYEQC